VIFQCPQYDWSAVAHINQGYFNKEHLVILTPKFKESDLTQDVQCQVLVKSGGKQKNIFISFGFVYKGKKYGNS
jgi:hypothetical protein